MVRRDLTYLSRPSNESLSPLMRTTVGLGIGRSDSSVRPALPKYLGLSRTFP